MTESNSLRVTSLCSHWLGTGPSTTDSSFPGDGTLKWTSERRGLCETVHSNLDFSIKDSERVDDSFFGYPYLDVILKNWVKHNDQNINDNHKNVLKVF